MSEILTCPWCNKPRATRADWERYEGGEGTHLCWADPRCEMDGDEEIVVVLRAALAAAERDATHWRESSDDYRRLFMLSDRKLAAAESERDRLRERLDQFEAYAITVSSALADRAYVEALGNELAMTRGAMAADDARLREAAIRVWGEHVRGCDTPDEMADLIRELRRQLAALSHLGTGAGRRAG